MMQKDKIYDNNSIKSWGTELLRSRGFYITIEVKLASIETKFLNI